MQPTSCVSRRQFMRKTGAKSKPHGKHRPPDNNASAKNAAGSLAIAGDDQKFTMFFMRLPSPTELAHALLGRGRTFAQDAPISSLPAAGVTKERPKCSLRPCPLQLSAQRRHRRRAFLPSGLPTMTRPSAVLVWDRIPQLQLLGPARKRRAARQPPPRARRRRPGRTRPSRPANLSGRISPKPWRRA